MIFIYMYMYICQTITLGRASTLINDLGEVHYSDAYITFWKYLKSLLYHFYSFLNTEQTLLFCVVVDTRYGLCYDNIDGGLCTGEMPVNISKSSCCCAVGSPAAWSYGGECESCPTGDNPLFELLCHMGIGYVEQPDGSIVGK